MGYMGVFQGLWVCISIGILFGGSVGSVGCSSREEVYICGLYVVFEKSVRARGGPFTVC